MTDPTGTQLQMRSLIRASGEFELSLASAPIPEPGPNEVLVRVQAAPLNPSDLGLVFGAADMSTARATGTPARPVVSATVPAKYMRAMAGRVDQPMVPGNEGAGAAGYWADTVHLTATGMAAMASLACVTSTSNPTVAPIPHQIRAITAGRCAVSSPDIGEVQLARPGHDDARLPVSLYLVASGGSAPTGAETPTLTVAASSYSGTASVAAGSYDAYAWSSTGPVMPLGAVTIAGSSPSSTSAGAFLDPISRGALGPGGGVGARALGHPDWRP